MFITLENKEPFVERRKNFERIPELVDRGSISSIIQSKSLSTDWRFNNRSNKKYKSREISKKTDVPNDYYDLDMKFLDKSDVYLSSDTFESNGNIYLERRTSGKKGREQDKKYYSNNNSIIELQQINDKRYVTCKTRVIPNSECSSPKIIKSKTETESKKEIEVGNAILPD
jgi:hypothetical protein